jgi:putative effector of murein hydrolase
MMLPNFTHLRDGMSLLKLGLECAGLNLLVVAFTAAGAEVGMWLAGASGGGIGLATGLAVGLASHAAGSGRIADKESRR